ncbi:hypothetical protein [Calothrix sp. NIES-2100]|uniref:hypothetical protein n=1 Tax=Calothrix sp. NIES-2100 TaxID=1954172 RepID=UPI0030D8A2CD
MIFCWAIAFSASSKYFYRDVSKSPVAISASMRLLLVPATLMQLDQAASEK